MWRNPFRKSDPEVDQPESPITESGWKPHLYKVDTTLSEFDDPPEKPSIHRQRIEPWLSSVFQSEHLSLLLGSGFTTGIASVAEAPSLTMGTATFGGDLEDKINSRATESARHMNRGEANLEDQLRSALSLLEGLVILDDSRSTALTDDINRVITTFMKDVLTTERHIHEAALGDDERAKKIRSLLVSFMLSFASRAASRERLRLFTTNYDRLVEYGCDLVGLHLVDRFVGGLAPVFRSSRVDVDLHYNPPGIRGEPRYLEGVIRLTKLHGSIDWRYQSGRLRRVPLSFGAVDDHPEVPDSSMNTVMVYPNPAKDIETTEYPYSELFRDFSAALCRPNSVLVTYGYGFGDGHVNRVIEDMLKTPSTHLVVISYNDADGRIPSFIDRVGHEAQISVLIGSHFGDLETLVRHYLPKPAIDQITWKKTDLLKRRGVDVSGGDREQDAGSEDGGSE